MTIHCSNCGFDNPPGMRFCGNCGTRLGEALPAPGITAPPVLTEAAAAQYDRYRMAGLQAAGQRRPVTVLFADLSGYTALSEQLDSEDVYFLIQEYIKLLADIVYRYDGFVDKFTGDGIMALFGAPIAQENNAELAVRAALDMQAQLARLVERLPERDRVQLSMRVGLHSGTVIVGGVGSDLQMNYTAIGDTVNLASRLEQAARPGTILVSAAVQNQTRALFEFMRQPPLTLKGISHPVQAYQVGGVRERPGSVRGLEGLRSPMVGRDSELAALLQTLQSLMERGQGGLAMITGEAGLGKSRLLSELKARVPAGLVQTFEGHSLTYRRTVSHWIFLDMLRVVLGVTPYTSEADARELLAQRLRGRMGARAAETQTVFERLLNLKPSNPAAAERLDLLDAGQLRQRVSMAFRDWLVAEAAHTPVLIVLEDLHWADDASLDLLQFLIDTIRDHPILMVATSRPFDEGPLKKIDEWARRRLGEHYEDQRLRTLSMMQSGQVLDNLLALLTLPARLRQEILRRAAGNPFYLEELLRMLLDKGIIRRESGQLTLAPDADLTQLGVPETLKELILSRFDRLPPGPRQFLQVAAAVGRRFNLALVEEVLRLPPDELTGETLPVLLEREFILPETAENEYQFQHVLVSDAVYGTLLARDRAGLHGSIGAAIEKLYAGHLEEQVELLARHYSWSNRGDRALYYLIEAARKSSAGFLNQQARQYYGEALELLPKVEHEPNQELQVHSGLGEVLLFLGDYAAAREHDLAALDLAGQLPLGQQVQARCNLQRQIGTTFERQGDYDQALEYLNRAQAALTAVSSRFPVERARVLNDIGWIHFRRGQLEEAETFLQRALWSVEPSTQPAVVASIYNRLGGVFYVKDDLGRASEYTRKSLELRMDSGDIAGVARNYNNLGLLEWRRGNWDEALQAFTRSVELHAELNDVEGTSDLHSNIGMLLTDQGSLEEARPHLEESLRTAQQIGHSFLEGLASQNLGYHYLAAGQPARALEFSRSAVKIFSDLGAQENRVDAALLAGEAHLRLGEADKAGETLNEIQAGLENARSEAAVPSIQFGRALRLAGRISRNKGRMEEASQLLRRSADEFTALDNQFDLGRTLAEQSRLAHALHDQVGCEMYASQARAIFAGLGARLDLQALDPA